MLLFVVIFCFIAFASAQQKSYYFPLPTANCTAFGYIECPLEGGCQKEIRYHAGLEVARSCVFLRKAAPRGDGREQRGRTTQQPRRVASRLFGYAGPWKADGIRYIA
ncbi:unnamed protein product, partial [Mesorhabditis spiculigera]